MRKRDRSAYLKILMSASLSIVFVLSGCSSNKESEPEISAASESVTAESSATGTSESISTTAFSYETYPSATSSDRINIAFIEEAYVCAVWYDAVEGNPANYYSIESADASALRGVFYFNSPITTVFQARLYKDKEIVMTRDIYMRDNVTAEADFFAGLEETDHFEPGVYYIELLFEDKPVATTERMKVK